MTDQAARREARGGHSDGNSHCGIPARGLCCTRVRGGWHQGGRGQDHRDAHDTRRSAGLRGSRRVPASPVHSPHPGRSGQREAQDPRRAGGSGDGADPWRQRHGASRHALCHGEGDRESEGRGRRLGRRQVEQPCGSGFALCLHAARSRHDRALPRGGKRQPFAAMGRARHAAFHQPDRRRGAGRGGAADRARHGDHGRRLRQGEDQGAARGDDAGGLDDGPAGPAADRSQARARGFPAAHRRLQGLRPRAHFRAARGDVERRRDGPGRGGLQRGRHDPHQHGSRHRRDRRRCLSAGGRVQAQRRRARP